MKRYAFYGMIGIVMILFLSFSIFAKDKNKSATVKLSKTTLSKDMAVGLLDMGKLIHGVLNDGRLSTWDYADIPCVSYKGHTYIPDLSMMIGVKQDPAWTPYTKDITGTIKLKGPTVSATFAGGDWGPKAGAYGGLHSGELTYGDVLSTATSLSEYPLMATSTFPLSWPRDANGYPYWPGMWATDPLTGKVAIDSVPALEFDFNNPTTPWKLCPTSDDTVLVGKFFSDKDIFFSMTDYDKNNQGYPYAESDGDSSQGYKLGIQLNITGLSYGRSYAEDVIFFPMQIINNSPYDYHGVYVGFYNDSDIPTSPHDNLDWMAFLDREHDAVKDTTYQYNMAYIYDYRYGSGNFPASYYKAFPAIKLLETPLAPRDIDFEGDGVIDRYQGEQLGITDWHWFDWSYRPGQVNTSRLELMTYKLISGDNTNILPEEDDAYFWPAPDGKLNPHFDSVEGFQDKYPGGMDCVFIMSSGPFDLAAGDTTTFSFAIVIGDDINDVKFNARSAQFMYELNYQGADPPPTPKVWAVAGNEKVTLYWDDAAEKAVDLMTAYKDFEGYKIYRTTAPPAENQWGDKIFDGMGVEVGFVPLAQFDLNNSISGLDPQYPHLNLGSNNGLVHMFVDSNLVNGQTYWYSVTAYDRGVSDDPTLNPEGWAPLNSLETAKGNNPNAAPNLVEIVPGKVPSNFVASDIKVHALPGTYANNKITIQIVDPFVITGHSYLISFDDTSGASTTFSLKDENTNSVLIQKSTNLNSQPSSIIDGMILRVKQKFNAITFDPDSSEWYHQTAGTRSACNWKFSGSYIVKEHFDYEIRFTAEPDTAFFPTTYFTPFEIWNITLNQKAKFAQYPPPNPADTTQEMKNTWTSGDELKVQEKIGGKTAFTFSFKLTAPPPKIEKKITSVEISPGVFRYDTTIVKIDTSVAPVTHDVIRLITGKPLKGKRDFYRINTAPYTSRAVVKEDLEKIKVVPNPYMISAEWEQDENYKKLAFTNLPTQCDIHVYTLSGERVISIKHDSATQGWEWWNMLSFNQQEIAYGCYIYVVETPGGQKKIGKFVILR